MENINSLDNSMKCILVVITIMLVTLIVKFMYTDDKFVTTTGRITNIQNCTDNKCDITVSYVIDKKNYTNMLLGNNSYSIGNRLDIKYDKSFPDIVFIT